jgi:hypothetical protein
MSTPATSAQPTTVTFAGRMSEIFKGTYPDTSAFMKDYKSLSLEDKAWYYNQLQKEGYQCLPPGQMAPQH